MGTLLVLVGLGGVLFGLINLIRPLGRLQVSTRRTAGWVVGGSFGVVLLGGAISPDLTEGLDPVPLLGGVFTTVVDQSGSTTTTELPTSSSSTSPATTTTVSPLPSVPHADVIFGSPVSGPSGDPEAPLDADAERVMVSSITDGDTMVVTFADGTADTVRLIGINTPEGGECWAEPASVALATLAPVGSQVGLTIDVSDRDQFDRLLRYVWVGSMSVNEELVRRGAGISRRYPPDTSFAPRFESAQIDAQADQLGLWAPDACGPPAEAELRIVDLVYDAPGNDNENLNEEWIRVRNNGDNLVDLSGWGIKDESASNRYAFPLGFSLSPGETVTIYSGCGDDFGTDLFWCSVGSAIWNNDGDTAFLTDPNGNNHATRTFTSPTTTSTTTTSAPASGGGGDSSCHPSYQGECVPVGVSDVDCLGGSGNGPYYVGRVTVVGPDVYGLDHDNDGIGCDDS